MGQLHVQDHTVGIGSQSLAQESMPFVTSVKCLFFVLYPILAVKFSAVGVYVSDWSGIQSSRRKAIKGQYALIAILCSLRFYAPVVSDSHVLDYSLTTNS